MPLASGSYPYRKPKRNSVTPLDIEASATEARAYQPAEPKTVDDEPDLTKQLNVGDPQTLAKDTTASQTYRESGQETQRHDNEGEQVPRPLTTSDSRSGRDKQPAEQRKPEKKKKDLVIPLDERPQDQLKIRTLISGAPLVSATAALAALALFVALAARDYTWTDYSWYFQNVVKGVTSRTRTREYSDHTSICVTAVPSGVDPDVIEGCRDIGVTRAFQSYLPTLIAAAINLNITAMVLAFISQRHLRWWMAQFTSPFAPIVCLVGELTGHCGEEPKWIRHLACADCGWIVSPATPALFSLIGSMVYIATFAKFWGDSTDQEIYRTEGCWLIITSGGLMLAAAAMGLWGQKVICPVKHVWHCDCSFELEKAKEDMEIMETKSLPDELPRQGLPHLIIAATRRASIIKEAAEEKGEQLAKFASKKILNSAISRRIIDSGAVPRRLSQTIIYYGTDGTGELPPAPPVPPSPFSRRSLASVGSAASMNSQRSGNGATTPRLLGMYGKNHRGSVGSQGSMYSSGFLHHHQDQAAVAGGGGGQSSALYSPGKANAPGANGGRYPLPPAPGVLPTRSSPPIKAELSGGEPVKPRSILVSRGSSQASQGSMLLASPRGSSKVLPVAEAV